MNKYAGLFITVSLITLMSGLIHAEVKPTVFKVGEKLDFKVYFEFILGGDATMEVKNVEKVNGRPCYHFVSTAKSTPTVDFFYKVRDKVQSWRDVKLGISRQFEKNLREGGYRFHKSFDYLLEDSIYVVENHLSRSEPETLEIIQPFQDVLSSFYYVRERDLIPGEVVTVFLEDDKKQYEVWVHVLRKETVEVPAGTFDCVVAEPRLKSAGLFRAEGTMQIWLTDDEKHMPVLMKSKLYFGRVWAKLHKYRLKD